MQKTVLLILVALLLCLSPAATALDEIVHVNPVSSLSIDSSPSGATLQLDGVTVGTTPFSTQVLPPGRHAVVLKKAGYQDYTATVSSSAASPMRVLYTLVPIPTPTPTPTAALHIIPGRLPTILPIIRPVVTPTLAPVPSLPAVKNPSWQTLKFPGPVSVMPLVIHVGTFNKTFHMTTLSPYFNYQGMTHPGVSSKFPLAPAPVKNLPTSYIEVDQLVTTDDVRQYYAGCSGEFCAVDADGITHSQQDMTPVWGDEATFSIRRDATLFNSSAFRWIPNSPAWTGALWQVSRYTFSTNASDYQNQHIPGLVASGQVNDFYLDKNGFHYFMINFARIASHNPGDPPYYEGPVSIHETAPGQGTPRSMVKIPGLSVGIYTDTASLGPLTIPYPAEIRFLSAGDLSENQLGDPNRNIVLSTGAWPPAASTTNKVSALLDTNPKYYVRVVPVTADGTAGIPTIPVEVTVTHPEPCPPCPSADSSGTQTFTIKPPSVQVSSFYMTSFAPDWIRTDDQGNLVSRAHYVSVSVPPNCDPNTPAQPPTDVGKALSDCLSANNGDSSKCSNFWNDATQCYAFKTRAHGIVGYHFYSDPPEGHWYDILVDIVSGLFSSFEQVIDGVSSAWNTIVMNVIDAASIICGSGAACKAVMTAVVDTGLSALGVPPTVPNFDELESMGADYMIKVAADQVGVGAAYDALPSDLQQAATGGVKDTVNDLVSSTQAQTGQSAGSWYVPDPLWYQPHPATLVVKVSNPNSGPTDPMYLHTSDTASLYRPKVTYIPPLRAGESTVIPLTLEENFDTVATPDCTWNSQWTEECDEAGDTCIMCYWNQWIFAAEDSSRAGGDTFVNTFSTKITGSNVNSGSYGGTGTYYLDGLDDTWGGQTNVNKQTIINISSYAQGCPTCGSSNQVTTYINYPASWQITTPRYTEDLWNDMWLKFQFSGGDEGMLRS